MPLREDEHILLSNENQYDYIYFLFSVNNYDLYMDMCHR